MIAAARLRSEYGADRDEIAFLASVFGLTGQSKHNLINVPK
jgi:hypothetical protein